MPSLRVLVALLEELIQHPPGPLFADLQFVAEAWMTSSVRTLVLASAWPPGQLDGKSCYLSSRRQKASEGSIRQQSAGRAPPIACNSSASPAHIRDDDHLARNATSLENAATACSTYCGNRSGCRACALHTSDVISYICHGAAHACKQGRNHARGMFHVLMSRLASSDLADLSNHFKVIGVIRVEDRRNANSPDVQDRCGRLGCSQPSAASDMRCAKSPRLLLVVFVHRLENIRLFFRGNFKELRTVHVLQWRPC